MLSAVPRFPERLQCAKSSADMGARPLSPHAQKCLLTPTEGLGGGRSSGGTVLALPGWGALGGALSWLFSPPGW